MFVQHSLAIVAFLAAFSACAAHISGGNLPSQYTGAHQFCGRLLARALAVLCYDRTSELKRSDKATMYDTILLPDYKNHETQVDWPWMSPHKVKGFGFSSRGKRYAGVVNECCDKACTMEELQTYC